MKYSPLYFFKNTPKEKWKTETVMCLLIYRPISFLVSSLFCFLRISANLTSFIGFLISLGATLLLLFNNETCLLISAILLNVWIIFDCVDGNLARCVKKMKYGDFLDAISYYVFVGPYFFALTYAAFLKGGLFFSPFSLELILFGGLGSSLYILSLLFRKKFDENSQKHNPLINETKKSSRFMNIVFHIMTEISAGGFMPLIILLGVIFNFLDVCVIAYAIFNFAVFIACSFLYCFKSFKANW